MTLCIVKGCQNHKGEGGFVGELCAPCYEMLTTGKIGHGTTFLHQPDDLTVKLTASLEAGISDDVMKSIVKNVESITCGIEDDIMYRLKDDLAPNLVAFVADMAKRTVEAILEGNEDQMRRYLGCERGHWSGRSTEDSGYFHKRDIAEWHQIIHWKFFEQGAMALRRDMVNAHADLIKNERILDLEDQVKSLVAQVNKAVADRNETWKRVSHLEEDRA